MPSGESDPFFTQSKAIIQTNNKVSWSLLFGPLIMFEKDQTVGVHKGLVMDYKVGIYKSDYAIRSNGFIYLLSALSTPKMFPLC